MINNAMTVDVEDYFQVSALAPYIPRESWDAQPCRIERNIDRILALFDQQGVKATFFTLGWLAERYPQMVRRLVADGHELASHGYAHRRVTDQTPAEFRDDITTAKHILEDISGVQVQGYRAPSFSICEKNLWAMDVLGEAGYSYSSSIYPVRHDHYGMPDAPRFAFRPCGSNGVLELPATTLAFFGRNLPAAGGGYFRLIPYALSRLLMRQVNDKDAQPCIFYFHPWEIDPGQPRQRRIGLKARFRHYVNLETMEHKLAALLKDFRWDRMDRVFMERPD
ncbi:MAG: XrtA system polysaccharide deacetylase [Burkholderiales bacterium]